jgi:hypothetical protein
MLKILACVIFISILNFSYAQLFGGQIKSNRDLASLYPAGSVFCASGPTAIVEFTNPTTGKTWMDRNLGASQVSTSATDAAAYGDLYQWGRRSDGHQCRSSACIFTLSSSDVPLHGDFIRGGSSPFDWRSPQNSNLWQGVNGINNPCPIGYRLPTVTEWENEKATWQLSVFPPIKNPRAGYRDDDACYYFSLDGLVGCYWTSTISSSSSIGFISGTGQGNSGVRNRAFGYSVRCIKN